MKMEHCKNFNERKEKRIPNERQLVAYIKKRLRDHGIEPLEHSRLEGSFDIIYISPKLDVLIGIEVKSESYISHIYNAIGQCVFRLGRGDAGGARIITNFEIKNRQEIQKYVYNYQLPIKLNSIENMDGVPYYVRDDEMKDWMKIG